MRMQGDNMPSVNWSGIERRLNRLGEKVTGLNERMVDMNATRESVEYIEFPDPDTFGAFSTVGFMDTPVSDAPVSKEDNHCRYCGMILARCGCGYGSE